MAGKTVSCLHFANDAIKRGFKVYYLDTESKPIVSKPHPNLFKSFYKENKEGFDKLFVYISDFDEEAILEGIKEVKPKLLIIDSIYDPYVSHFKYKIKHP